jgi:Low psii accumulation1 / Rep27
MTEPAPDSASQRPKPKGRIDPKLDPELYAQLRAEAKAPYRGLRQFIYLGFGASGLIGAFIFLMQLLAGRQVEATLPNFALQVGVVALMVWLFRLEQRASKKP